MSLEHSSKELLEQKYGGYAGIPLNKWNVVVLPLNSVEPFILSRSSFVAAVTINLFTAIQTTLINHTYFPCKIFALPSVRVFVESSTLKNWEWKRHTGESQSTWTASPTPFRPRTALLSAPSSPSPQTTPPSSLSPTLSTSSRSPPLPHSVCMCVCLCVYWSIRVFCFVKLLLQDASRVFKQSERFSQYSEILTHLFRSLQNYRLGNLVDAYQAFEKSAK